MQTVKEITYSSSELLLALLLDWHDVQQTLGNPKRGAFDSGFSGRITGTGIWDEPLVALKVYCFGTSGQ